MTRDEFLKDVSDPDNHRVLLWLALEEIKRGLADRLVNDAPLSILPVCEFGAGTGSTPYFRKYCHDEMWPFYSYDSDKDWAHKWGASWVTNWFERRLYVPYSVVLIDQAPGEYRHESMIVLSDMAQIIVVHDAEPDESMGYRLSEIWKYFKYRIFYKGTKIWCAAVSNSIDLTKFDNTFIGDYKIEI